MKAKNRTLFVSTCSILAAFSIILGKYLAINIGTNFRLSFENLPILLAGIYLGPIAGAVVGAVADLTGCLLVGYSINPLITLGAVSIGFLSGLPSRIFRTRSSATVFISIFSAHLIGSVVIKTMALYLYYGSPLIPTAAWRATIYGVTGTAEFAILYLLSKNKEFIKQMQNIHF